MQFRLDITNVVVTVLISFTLIGCQAKPFKQNKVYCDPVDHKYYNHQVDGCKKCDRCWPGEEPDLKGVDVGMGLHGATKCPRCRECRDGTFNPDGDKYWNCLPCTVCADLGMHEVQPCSSTQNTKCNKTALTVNERLGPRVSDIHENVQERRPKLEAEESHTTEKMTDILMGVVVTVVVALVMCFTCSQRKRICQKLRGHESTLDTDEMTPLHTTRTEPDCSEKEQSDSSDLDQEGETDNADDRLSSLRDIRKKEMLPLVPRRQRYHSCGDYESTRDGCDKYVGKNKKEIAGRTNPTFQRQLSYPVTNAEVGTTELQFGNKRPSQRCTHVLSKLLAPNKKYIEFANHMGIEKHQIELIEEYHKQRNFSAEDLSYEYISKVLQCKAKLSYHDIYKALAYLGLHEELASLQEKRRRTYM
ncbi:uncharacterized protein LOC117329050 [Pecten maximus]|uniref:uncharacterized protein LOC117329050 n=1 Tax=Pecten maximus TaxID=6579 RepID=UPI001458FC02|nr:uncharacterized protein LOC117329050 [Pecten maximus]